MKYFDSINKSKFSTLSSTIIGFALIGNFNAIEQNALGNWLMLVGQILETNAAFEQLNNSKKQELKNMKKEELIKQITKALEIMKNEIENLK